MELILKLMDLDDIQRFDHQQRIHKKTVALMSRYTAGRGMGAGNKAHFLEIRHHVSNRGGAQIQARKIWRASEILPAGLR